MNSVGDGFAGAGNDCTEPGSPLQSVRAVSVERATVSRAWDTDPHPHMDRPPVSRDQKISKDTCKGPFAELDPPQNLAPRSDDILEIERQMDRGIR